MPFCGCRGQETYLRILFEGEHDLRGAVPARRDVLGHEPRFLAAWVRRARGAREAKVAHLEVAVGVEEEVGGLEVAVDDVGAVHGFDGSQDLIDEELVFG